MTTISQNRILRNEPFFLGIDGGGTKCKAVIIDNKNQVLGVGVAGVGNPIHGVELAKKSIIEAASVALSTAKEKFPVLVDYELGDIVAGFGLAGVNVPTYFTKINEWHSPFKSVHLTSDLEIACIGAHDGKDGAVIVAGTGSCGYVSVDGQSKIIGAHGFPQGDQGSGAWFGLRAIESVLLSLDDMGPPTTIADYISVQTGTQEPELLVAYVASKSSSVFASLAHTVFQAAKQGDQVAQSIIVEGVGYLEAMARALLAYSPPRLSFLGGLSSTITPYFSLDIQEKIKLPIYPPEVGAAIFARQCLT